MSTQKKPIEEIVGRSRRGGGPHISLERRQEPRLPAVDYRIWVGRWSSLREFATVAARVENISRGGVRLLTTEPFVESDDVWLRLASPEYDGCVCAEVLRVSATGDGDYLSRLRFYEPCPDPFFDVVTKGLRDCGASNVGDDSSTGIADEGA
ncbi:PilZ domain-containing protein [Paludisphaera mucosa]|uniref:PilZ domain-containing protein n=1 Tax=Paludisphaera mucosa TaxID=3030827 RepID=A0ABT6F5S3_9BACT|nr:PilZ domain-containing protein [Paludisphaera mucosa]MDG3002933.1 PilZ domain-containing protein [Paludisphaera mucosa]